MSKNDMDKQTARLIAAAPDLLAAAEDSADRLEGWAEFHESSNRRMFDGPLATQHRNQAQNYRAVANQLRAAIAKAKGGA